jgi:ABC-type dipeptide/oligopeptide/nickel transport system permease component
MQEMMRFVAVRLALSIPTLLLVLTVVFVLVRVVPGDPALVVLGDQASQAALADLRTRLGLDRPLTEQYFAFVLNAVQGDWGTSLVTGQPVLREVAAVLPYTIDLTLASILVGVVLGLPCGIWAALRRNSPVDYATRVLSLLGLSFPSFVSGILLLLVFAIHLPWFPVINAGGLGDPVVRLRNLVLPSACLGLIMAGYVTRVTRSAMLEVLSEDYIRTARAKGVPRRVIIWQHALRNALIPVITVIGLYLGILIGNSVLVEIVFSRPGLGKLIVGALNQRDYTMLQGLMVVYAFVIVLVNLLTDLTYSFVDPRVKTR